MISESRPGGSRVRVTSRRGRRARRRPGDIQAQPIKFRLSFLSGGHNLMIIRVGLGGGRRDVLCDFARRGRVRVARNRN